jgi:peptide/nickel transport system substrate-binding protein
MVFILWINISYPCDSIIYLRSIDSQTLDPGLTEDLYSSEVIANIFEGLVRYKLDKYEIEPCLARKWEVKDNGKTWIFFLRKDVIFHNGKKFDDKSVISNFKRRIGKDKNLKRIWFFFPYIKDIESIDKFIVKITLIKPYAPLLSALTDPTALIVAPESYKGKTFIPIGTGPFKFHQWEKGKSLVIRKNEKYWDGQIPTSRIIFKIMKNPATKTLQLKSGNADLVRIDTAFELEELIGIKDIIIFTSSSMSVRYLAFNTQKYPFNKVEVRKAIAHLFNKKGLVKHLFQNMAISAKTPVPPVLFGYNKDIKDYEYNLEKARSLLRKVGLGKGFTCKLYFSEKNKELWKIANVLAGNARQVNIIVEKVALPFIDLMNESDKGEHDLGIFGWIGAPDPDFFLYPLFTLTKGNKNRSFYVNQQVSNLLEKARATLNRERRIEYYRKVQRIIHRDMPWVPLYHQKSIVAYQKNLQNLYIFPNDYLMFRYVKKGKEKK